MLKHYDYDNRQNIEHHFDSNVTIPDSVELIQVSHDGGRLKIAINGEVLYETLSGTRDCSIAIDKE